MQLPSGPPTTSCERQRWSELAPARTDVAERDAYLFFVRSVRRYGTGHGIFEPGGEDPQLIPDLLPRMGEPELASDYMRRIAPTLDRENVGLAVTIGGAAVSAAGLALMFATPFVGRNGALPVLISGSVAGVTGSIVAGVGRIGMTPDAEERASARVRERIFRDGEADMAAIMRGVDRLNARVREACRRER